MRAALPCLVMSMTACSLLLGEGYAGGDRPLAGADDAGAMDGQPSAIDPNDASGQSADAGGDAGPFCASHTASRFCDDFDDRLKPFQQTWTINADTGGNVSLSTERGVSTPNSIFFKTGSLDSAVGSSRANALRTFKNPSTPISEITIASSVYFDRFPTQATSWFAFSPIYFKTTTAADLGIRTILYRVDGQPRQQLEHVVYPNGGGNGEFGQGNIAPLIKEKTWVRLVEKVVLGSSPVVTLTADEVPICTLPLRAEFVPAEHVEVGLGFQYLTGPSEAVGVWTDNVVVDFK